MKRKLATWTKGKGEETKMACYMIDALFERKKILNYTIAELIEKEERKMKFIFSYTMSYFEMAEGEQKTVRKAINDKLSHFSGRTTSSKNKKKSVEVDPKIAKTITE